MKKLAFAGLLAAALIGCGGKAKPAATTEAPKDAAATGGTTYGGTTYGANPCAAATPANPCAEKKQ